MNTDELIEQTKHLIRIPSTADNPKALKEAVDFVAAIVQKCPSVTIERFEQNNKPSFLAYYGPTRPDKFDVLLNAHVDVVAAPAKQFIPVEKGGRLYGRGALDMKGTAVVLANVFCEMASTVPYNLALQIVSDEEVGGYDGAKHQLDQGVRADFVIVGEYANTKNVIYNAARGACWVEIAFNGKTAHGAHLWNGTNAVVAAQEFAAAVLKRYPTPDKQTWATTANIANLSTPNRTYNKVPDKAVLRIDFRFTDDDPVFEDELSLKAFIASVNPEAQLVRVGVFEPAISVDELNPYVQGLTAALRSVNGKSVEYQWRPGGSDGRHFASVQSGVVEFGLYGQGSHSKEEHVELSSFDEYCKVMRAFLAKPIPGKLKQRAAADEPLHLQSLRRLVLIPTVTSDRDANNTALAYVEHFLTKRGMHVKRFERDGYSSIVATTKRDQKHPKIMLDAHLDVAPAGKGQFQITIDGGIIRGRGVADIKFALASYMALVDELKDDLAAYDFGIAVSCDGKIGSNNGIRMIVNDIGYRADVAVVPGGGENWELEAFSKGLQWVKLTASGKSAHASRPWEGQNAIDKLLVTIEEIRTIFPKSPEPKDTFVTVGTIQGGAVTNQIASSASATLDIRTGSTEDHARTHQQITEICAKNNVKAEWLMDDTPVVSAPDHPLIKPFVDDIVQVTGRTHKTSYSYGVSHARFYNAAGIPCIVVAPPSGDRHKDTEWLSRKGFDQFYNILRQYIEQVGAKKELPNQITAPAGDEEYVWYANYGSGLSYENFMLCIRGGTPEGAAFGYVGCTDQTPPLQDHFVSLPYRLYFSDTSKIWPGGGLGTLDLEPNEQTSTIARIYLITRKQFEEIAAQENFEPNVKKLPFSRAIQNGHAHINYTQNLYDELLFCGMRDNYPIFALTGNRLNKPVTAPSVGYTQCVLKGLSENAQNTSGTTTQFSTAGATTSLNTKTGLIVSY